MKKILTILFCVLIAGALNMNAQNRVLSEFPYRSYSTLKLDKNGEPLIESRREISALDNGYFVLRFEEQTDKKTVSIHLLEYNQNKTLINTKRIGQIFNIDTRPVEGIPSIMFTLRGNGIDISFLNDGIISIAIWNQTTYATESSDTYYPGSTESKLYPHKFTALKDKLMNISWISKK